MRIVLLKKSVYGKIRYYPVCEFSQKLVDWLNKKTFNQKDLDHMRELNIKVDIQVFRG